MISIVCFSSGSNWILFCESFVGVSQQASRQFQSRKKGGGVSQLEFICVHFFFSLFSCLSKDLPKIQPWRELLKTIISRTKPILLWLSIHTWLQKHWIGEAFEKEHFIFKRSLFFAHSKLLNKICGWLQPLDTIDKVNYMASKENKGTNFSNFKLAQRFKHLQNTWNKALCAFLHFDLWRRKGFTVMKKGN